MFVAEWVEIAGYSVCWNERFFGNEDINVLLSWLLTID